MDEIPNLHTLNTTELWQMAARMGINGAGPATQREQLIHAIEALEHINMVDPTDALRERASNFWVAHWDRVQMQMPKAHCPNCHLKHGMDLTCRITGEERETYCSDMEFIDCFLDNKHK